MAPLAFPVQDFGLIVAFLCCLYITTYNIVVPGLAFAALCTVYLVFCTWREAKQVEPDDKYVLITGCDTGFGNGIARLLDRKGYHVFATCYSDTSEGANELKIIGSQRMRVLQLDITSQDSVDACLLKVTEKCGEKGLWAVVNNAGIQLAIDAELLDMEAYYKMCEVNMFGIVRVCKAFLPLVRRRIGRIVNVTSLCGTLAFIHYAGYCMSKFGAEGFTDCLRLEMMRFGVKVILVEPGNYGGHTGGKSSENQEMRLQLFRKLVAKSSDEVKQAYGEDYLATFTNRPIVKIPPYSDKKIRGVLESLESAVCSCHPRIRYLTGSTNLWIDFDIVLGRLARVLPASVMDSLIVWRKPFPKASSVKKD